MPIMLEKPIIKCKHPRTEFVTGGHIRYENGEVIDNLKEIEVCSDCGEVIEEEKEEIIF